MCLFLFLIQYLSYWFLYIYNSYATLFQNLNGFLPQTWEIKMRQQTRKPIEEMQVDQVKLELNSRDDIPQVL